MDYLRQAFGLVKESGARLGTKRKKIIIILAAAAAVYLTIRYAIPPLLPFLLGYFVCVILYRPTKKWIDSRLYPKKLPAGLAFGFSLLLFLAVISTALYFLFRTGLEQLRMLIANWDSCRNAWDIFFSDTCGRVDRMVGMESGTTYFYCCEKLAILVKKKEEELAERLLGLSVPTMKIAGEVIAFFGAAILSAYFFMTEKRRREEEKPKPFFLKEEFTSIKERLKEVFGAYLRAQGILMVITAAICTIGLTIIQNPYSLLIGVLIGFLDALPLIGTGLILIPWIIFAFLAGHMKNAVILLVTYLICYAIREFLEPKLIGKHAGISPLITLISVYVGYQMFGIFGVVWGPVAYVLIQEITTLAEQREY